MVNKAIEDLVRSNFGEDSWNRIKERAGVDEVAFISNEPYPDDVTFRLVGAASEVLKIPAEKILHSFGEHWILKTAREGYGEMLDASGKSLAEFLKNLPNFHTRVAMIFPKLEPPRFEVSDETANSLRLHYFTHRTGLSMFVVGLVSGLAKMFETKAVITHDVSRDAGADHDEFLVTWE